MKALVYFDDVNKSIVGLTIVYTNGERGLVDPKWGWSVPNQNDAPGSGFFPD